MKVDIYNKSGKKLSAKIELNNKVFKIDPNEHCIYLAIKSELAAKRQGTSSSKTRSEVRGGGRKPYKQKGTGNSRLGSTRNPARVHGGVAFGPKPRSYNLKVNKKVKSVARKSALSMKVINNSYKILDNLTMKDIKTKNFVKSLENLNIIEKKIVVISNELCKNLYLSSRNLETINLVNVKTFSTYDVINSNYLLIDKPAVEYLNKNLV
jgi:large subunit ribosomal protein L4